MFAIFQRAVFAAMVALAMAACAPATGTTLEGVTPRTVAVGNELEVYLRALGGDSFDFESDIDFSRRTVLPSLLPYGGGQAVFRWTPLADDVGDHVFQFSVRANGVDSTATMPVTVLPGSDQLAFRQPIGAGTTFDFSAHPCLSVEFAVDNASADEVALSPGEPWAANAELEQTDSLTAQLKFCPTAAEVRSSSVFPLLVLADSKDGRQHAEKRFAIVIGKIAPALDAAVPPDAGSKPMDAARVDADLPSVDGGSPDDGGDVCPIAAPVIVHTAKTDQDVFTYESPLHINALVTNPDGLQGVLLFYSSTPPADMMYPDLTKMSSIELSCSDCTETGGHFSGTVRNPVASLKSGSRKTFYYLLSAIDYDDVLYPGCDYHVTFDPPTGLHSFTTVKP